MQQYYINRNRFLTFSMLLGTVAILGIALFAPKTSIASNTYSAGFESDLDQYLSIEDANQTGLDITGDLTIEAWIKRESTAAQIIVGKYDGDGGASQRSYALELDSTGANKIDFLVSNGTTQQRGSVTYSIGTGTWHHITSVYTASLGQVEFFVDGVSVGTSTGLVNSIANTSIPFYIGTAKVSAVTGNHFDGLIDEVRVWSEARTGNEVVLDMWDSSANSDPNLEGYWRFENNYLDSSNNGNDLIIYGLNADVPYNNTHALDLEKNSQQYLSISDASQTGLDVTSDLTIEAWVKRESTGAQIIAGKYDGDGGASLRSYALELESTGSNKIDFLVSDGTTQQRGSVTHSISTGAWHHIASVYTASLGKVEFFVDGVSVGTSTGLVTSITNTSIPFYIGTAKVSAGTGNHFDGLIDEVRVWSEARTGNEVLVDMWSLATDSSSTLEGHWKLENNGTDSSSNANNLTNYGSATYVTDTH